MDFITRHPKFQVKDRIYVFVDRIINHAYFFLFLCIIGNHKLLIYSLRKFLGFMDYLKISWMIEIIIYSIFVCKNSFFWQEASSYPIQVATPNGQNEIVKKSERLLEESCCWPSKGWIKWVHLRDHCYNTNYHMSIRITSFIDFYGYEAQLFLPCFIIQGPKS